MSVTSNQVNPLERTILLSIPVSAIDNQIGSRIKNLQRTVKMPGFRPGKVPLRMVDQYYGMQVRQEVLNDEVFKAFDERVRADSLKVAGYPRFAPVNQDAPPAGSDIQVNATFEIYPEVSVADLSKKAVEQKSADVADADIDRTIETLRKQRATFAPVDRAAAEGDMMLIDFEGKLDGVAFDGGKAANFGLVLGEKRLLPDFEAALVGVKSGGTKSFPVAFPADYQAAELQGKTAEFSVVVHQISEPQLPPVDVEFAKNFGIADGDVTKLRAEVKKNLEREAKRRSINLVKDQVMQALADAHEFVLPASLVEMEINKMQEAAKADLKARGMTTNDMELPRDLFLQGAQRRIKLGLVVAQIIQQNNLKAEPKKVRELIEEQAQSYEDPAALVKWMYTQPDRMREVEDLVLENTVVEWALERMDVTKKDVGLFELMGQQQ
jgi:trigger factor